MKQNLCWRRWPCREFKETKHRLALCGKTSKHTARLVLTQAHAPRFAAARYGEAQDAAPDDAEDSSAPADVEGGAQLISAENSSSSFPLFILHACCTLTELLLLCHKQRVEKLCCDLVGVDGARRERAEAWGRRHKEDKKFFKRASLMNTIRRTCCTHHLE